MNELVSRETFREKSATSLAVAESTLQWSARRFHAYRSAYSRMLREAAVPKEQYVAAQTSGHPCRPEKLKAISHRRHRQPSRGVQSNHAYVGTEQLIFLRLL